MIKNAGKNTDLDFDYVIFDSLSVIEIRRTPGKNSERDLHTLEILLGLVQDLEDDLDDGLALEMFYGEDSTSVLVDTGDLRAIESELDGTDFSIVAETPVLSTFYFGEISVCQHPEGWVLL